MPGSAPPSDPRNNAASALMHLGIDLLESGTLEGLEEAVRCFDEAIAIRLGLPWREVAWYRHVLAAGWMNRGDALTRLDRLEEALQAYDSALEVLREIPLVENPLFPRRLSIAWINRGFTLRQMPQPGAAAEAVRSFREGVKVLEAVPDGLLSDHGLLRAGAWLNLAAAELERSPVEARAAAQTALDLSRDLERKEAAAGETALKARHVLCQAIAAGSADGRHLPPEMLTEATDLIEEALALVRHWERAEPGRLAPLARGLFAFGCRLYRAHQPQFLIEFVFETLESRKDATSVDAAFFEVAAESFWDALRDIQHGDFDPAERERQLARLGELREAEARLRTLRRGSPT